MGELKKINLIVFLLAIIFIYILYKNMPNIGNNVTISVFGILVAGIAGLLIRNTFTRIVALIVILVVMIIAFIIF